MKNKVVPILIAALVISQVLLLARINDLQSQLNNARSEINNQSTYMRNEINTIYSNVDETLKREASLIEIASTVLGTLNVDTLTAPITFSITPKEVSENTAVSLNIDGELIPMDKTGTTFTATVNRDIFGSASPMIVIDENGVKKTTQDDRIMIWSMKDSLLPSLHPRLMGQSSYGGGNYKVNKTLQADYKHVESGITFTEMRFAIKVDDEIISDELIPADSLPDGWTVDRTIPLKDGQTCVMTVIATDSIGLEHRCTVDHWVGGANAQREPWFDDEQIYSADGKLLWKPEYTLVG